MTEIFDIAVIGAGAGGSMGALRGVLNNKSVILFHGDPKTKKKARATWVDKVVNMPLMFDKRKAITASVDETLTWIREHDYFSKKFTEVKQAITQLSKDGDIFTLTATDFKTGEESQFQAKFVLLATGIMDTQPEIQGSIRPVLPFANNGFIDYCIRCDGHKSIGKITATIGHNNVAAWVAALLHERYQPPETKIFTNGQEPTWSGDVVDLIKAYKIKVVTEPIAEIIGKPKEYMEGFKLESGELEKVELAFPMLGQIAYNDLAKQVGAELTEKGNVVTNEKAESSVPGLYVAGDLRAGTKYQIYTAWNEAVDAVDDMDAKLRLEYRQQFVS